jgi:hypothetical protein
MNTSLELWGYISALVVFIVGIVIAQKSSGYFGVKQRYSIFLYLWHTLFCLIYFWYLSNNVGDALGYYRLASLGEFELKPGTNAVLMINYVFIYGLSFSLLGAFLVNNIFGFLGLLAFKGALNKATENKSKRTKQLGVLTVLLPSISFWSSALGKDSISFMATGFALWAALNLEKRTVLMAFAIFIMFLVRPHIAGIMIIALAFSIVLSTKISLMRRIMMGIVTLVITSALVPFALQYAGISDPSSSESLMDFVEGRQSVNTGGGSSINIASMSLPMQMFTYAFRPTLIEVRNVFSLAAAIDNLILLYLFIAGSYALLIKKHQSFNENRKFMWAYVFLTWIVLAMTTANLGIALRQKWMFTPILIFLLISLIGKERNRNSSR